MQLLTYTDYALRALLYLAAHPGEPVGASAIAAAYGISPDHVAKATKALTRAGLLEASRGAGGGVQLGRAPEAIRIGDVVRLFEGDRGLVECFREGGTCVIEPSCALRTALRKAEEAFFAELDRHTLADVVQRRAPLVRLLRGAPERMALAPVAAPRRRGVKRAG